MPSAGPRQHNGNAASSAPSRTGQPANYMAANFSILARRWPGLAQAIEQAAATLPPFSLVEKSDVTLQIDGVHLTSAYDRTREARLQAGLIPAQSREAWVYGMALGDVPRVLLARRPLQALTVVVTNCTVAALSLYFFDHRDWLEDPRVSLVAAAPQDQLHTPFTAAPGCLQLADDAASRLRDLVSLELATPFIRKRHRADNPHLQKRLAANAPYVAEDPSIDALVRLLRSSTVVVAGAGPTLSDHYAWLKNRKPGPLIAVDAALKPLLEAGIVPDIVMTIDGHADIYDLFFANLDLKALRNTALVYFPAVQNEVLKHWPGQRYAAYSRAPLYADLAARHPKPCLFSSGSVIHPATDLATRLADRKVVFIGADFSYPGGATHVAGCAQARPAKGNDWVLNGCGQRVATIPNMRAYLRDLESFLATQPRLAFFNAGARGAEILHTTLLEEAL